MKALLVLVGVLCGVQSGLANADESVHLAKRFGVGADFGLAIPTYSQVFQDNTDSGWAGNLHLRYFFTDKIGAEFSWDHLQFSENRGRTIGNSYSGGLLMRFSENDTLTAIGGVGIGFGETTRSQLAFLNFNGLSFNAKFGIDYSLDQDWILEGGLKYFWFLNSTNVVGFDSVDVNALVPYVGITYYFNRGNTQAKPEPTPTAADPFAYAAAIDSDRDGVYDESDRCPGTPLGTVVDSYGCAIPVAPVDSDRDGVYDSEDRCPGTPRGTPVNSVGCAHEESFEVRLKVEFDTDRSSIRSGYHGELQEMADFLLAHPDLNMQVQGHTDSVGSSRYNLKLSSERARSVRNYLVNRLGVPAKRLTSIGYGETRPIANNSSESGRQQNRRVVGVLTSRD